MTDKDEKGAAAPPAITPRKHVPRPSVTKAKTTGPVPAPPGDAGRAGKASAASTKNSADSTSDGSAAGISTVQSSAPSTRPQGASSSAPAVSTSAQGVTSPVPASPVTASPVTPSPQAVSPTAPSPVSPSPMSAAAASPVTPVRDAAGEGWEGSASSRDVDDENVAAAVPAGAARKVRLSLSRVDPWSVMKLSFLLSVAGGIMLIVASWVFWYAINDMGIFTQIDEMVRDIVGAESTLDILQYVERDKVLSLATLIAVVDVVLLTALGTIGAFLYNVTAALVGGLHVTLTDE